MPSLQELLAAKRKEREGATAPEEMAEVEVQVEKQEAVEPVKPQLANPFSGLAASLSKNKQEVAVSKPAPASMPAAVTAAKPAQVVDAETYKHSTQLDAVQEQELASLQGAIDLLRDHMDVPDLVGDSIRNVMTLIQARPYLAELMRPEDMGALVRGLRESYGVVIQKKQENRSKRAKSVQKADEFEKLMLESGGDLGNLKF